MPTTKAVETLARIRLLRGNYSQDGIPNHSRTIEDFTRAGKR